MKKDKDWTDLTAYKGMSWRSIAKVLPGNLHMLAMSPKEENVEAAKEIAKGYETSAECGMAVFLAYLCFQTHGLHTVAGKAICMYKEIAQALLAKPTLKPAGRKKVEKLLWEVHRMTDMTCWGRIYDDDRHFKWPVNPPFLDDPNKKAGLANILLFLSARELEQAGTGEIVAAGAMVRFLREGLEANEKRTKRARSGNKDVW